MYFFAFDVLIEILEALLIRIKIRSLNTQIYVSNKFILNFSKSDFKLEQWQVEIESTERKVKRLKS